MDTPYIRSLENFTLRCSELETGENDENISEYLLKRVHRHIAEDKTIWTTDTISGESYTFAQFVELSQNVASALYKRGLRKGDIVIYMCFDIVKLHIFINGVWRANGVVRSLYPEELEDSILETVIQSNAKWIVCENTEANKCLSVSKKANWPIEIIVMGLGVEGCTSIYDLFQDDGNECPELETNRNDSAIILSTSGTTGRSKGAVHSHKSILSLLKKVEINFPFGERTLFCSRGTHLSGSLISMGALAMGKSLLTMSRVTPANVFAAVKVYKPDCIFAFPALLLALLNDIDAQDVDISTIEYVNSGGTNIKPSLRFELQEKLPNFKLFSTFYGMTESNSVVSSSYRAYPKSPCVQLPGLPDGSMGKVTTGVSAQVRDEAGESPLGANQEGELWIKSSTMVSGYFKQEEETRKVLTADGWFRTGDIVYYDEQGFLYFRGRKKEMFKSSGYNHIFPVEIEEVISEHPSVADVCAVGVDDPAGEKMPRAFVILKPGVHTTAEEIKQFAHKNLPTYKYLRGGVYIVSDLPKGSTGKITRQLVAGLPVPE